jgi:hypothetical protein
MIKPETPGLNIAAAQHPIEKWRPKNMGERRFSK